MSWQISDLLTHWSRKHSRAVYVRRTGNPRTGFTNGPYVHLGEGINWNWFHQALGNGTIVLDPAYNMLVGGSSMVKERAQFRCTSHALAALYPSVRVHDLRHFKPSRTLAHADLQSQGITLPSWLETDEAGAVVARPVQTVQAGGLGNYRPEDVLIQGGDVPVAVDQGQLLHQVTHVLVGTTTRVRVDVFEHAPHEGGNGSRLAIEQRVHPVLIRSTARV